MKAMQAMIAAGAGVAFLAAAAEAAPKKRNAPKRPPIATAQPYPNAVYSYDGTLLGADPDPFIRSMLVREGNPRDQSGI